MDALILMFITDREDPHRLEKLQTSSHWWSPWTSPTAPSSWSVRSTPRAWRPGPPRRPWSSLCSANSQEWQPVRSPSPSSRLQPRSEPPRDLELCVRRPTTLVPTQQHRSWLYSRVCKANDINQSNTPQLMITYLLINLLQTIIYWLINSQPSQIHFVPSLQ